ncbi:MAG: hypothetical protein QOE13_3439 [Gaiellaceae bacterium]|nr:hypothetical protein [Gaiellaceae bacterium]
MLTEEALAEASAAVLALPLRLWQGPVLPLVGREATFGARPTVSEIQLHFPVDPDGPLGVEVCLAAWSLPVAGYVELLEPLSPEEARAVDRRLRGG